MERPAERRPDQFAASEYFGCPHCGEKQPDEIEAYVIAGTMTPVRDHCESCHKPFSILELSSGLFKLTALKAPEVKKLL